MTHPMDARPIDVTVLFLEEGNASTAIGPLEVFGAAGVGARHADEAVHRA